MANLADRVADTILSHTVDLSRHDVEIRAQVVGMLDDLRNDLTLRMSQLDPTSGRTETVRQKRQQQLLVDATKSINTAYKGIAAHSEKSLFGVGKVVVEGTTKGINAAIGVDLTSASMTPGLLKQLVNSDIVMGAPAKDWWNRQNQNTRDGFTRQIRLGMMGGENLGQLLQRVRGEATGRYVTVEDAKGKKRKVPEFAGGVLATSTREATALVRTSVQSVANAARLETYNQNPDVIKGVQALVTLDGRTSDICKSRSGMSWTLPDGAPMKGTSIPFPGAPPWHYNCRSTLVPVMKSWAELAGKRSKLKQEVIEELEEKIAPEMQASMDGQVAGDLTYEDWLKKKPEAFQREVLGAGRYDLWKEGKLQFSDLTGQSGDSLTLKQLRDKFDVKEVVEEFRVTADFIAEHFDHTKLKPLGSVVGSGQFFTYEDGGKKWFVKLDAFQEESPVTETAVVNLARQAGLGDFVTDTSSVRAPYVHGDLTRRAEATQQRKTSGQATYLVQEWKETKPLHESLDLYTDNDGNPVAKGSAAGYINSLDKVTKDKLSLFEYLIGDTDRHTGNYLFNPATKDLRMIDFGFAFTEKRTMINPTAIQKVLRIGTSKAGYMFGRDSVAEMLRLQDAFETAATTSARTDAVLGVTKRFNALKAAYNETDAEVPFLRIWQRKRE